MKIYTKGGDQGETSLFGGKRVKKNHHRIEVYGTLDELNATLGMALSHKLPESTQKELIKVQSELFSLGAELATPSDQKLTSDLIGEDSIQTMEAWIDAMEAKLPALTNFILPGGSQEASILHLSRTVCRRAERALIRMSEEEKVRPEVYSYLNRLSDYLFVCTRFVNRELGFSDVVWK